MPSAELVMIDTSVWIDFFSRSAAQVGDTLTPLFANGNIATAGIILAELTQGARTVAEGERLRQYLQPLEWIDSTDHHWEAAGQLSWKVRRKGHTVNLTDCYIACLAASAHASIYTFDKHFTAIAAAGGCTLYVA